MDRWNGGFDVPEVSTRGPGTPGTATGEAIPGGSGESKNRSWDAWVGYSCYMLL